jgi:hypothetical protein
MVFYHAPRFTLVEKSTSYARRRKNGLFDGLRGAPLTGIVM